MNRNYVVRDFSDRTEADCALKQGSEQWHNVALCFDSGLADCERRVRAVSLFHPLAQPSNPTKWSLPDPNDSKNRDTPMTNDQKESLARLKNRMNLHRALVRGNGFYDWMTKDAPQTLDECKAFSSLAGSEAIIKYRALPVVNFLDFGDDARADAIVNEALPEDRDRFRAYLSSRPLGLGIIAAVSCLLYPHTLNIIC